MSPRKARTIYRSIHTRRPSTARLWGASSARQHDPTYRQIFSHPIIARMLLEDFIGAEHLGALDFGQMVRQETTFIAEALSKQQSDMLWKIKRIGELEQTEPAELFVLIEFQSTVDQHMPSRVVSYASLVGMNVAREQPRAAAQGRAPAIISIVIYNGAARWSAKTSMEAMIGLPAHSPLLPFVTKLHYHLVDVGRLSQKTLRRSETILSALFQIERTRSVRQLKKLVQQLAALLKGDHMTLVRRDVLMWLREAFRGKNITLQLKQVNAILQEENMLAQKIEKWFQEAEERGKLEGQLEGKLEGKIEGKIEGKRELLLVMIAARFGEDDSRYERVERLSVDELDQIAARLFKVEREEELYEL